MIALCRSPYYKHPIGCPNWDHKDGCPPHTKRFLSVYEPTVYIAIARLDFGKYLKLKEKIHPGWTEKALKNPRHWQGHLRAALRNFLTPDKIHTGFEIVKNAEAMGINLFETCANARFVLERDPKNFVCHINLLANGRSLSEISTPITGLTSEETLERRNDFLEFINQMDEAGLRKHLSMIEHQIDVALSRPIQGTSELYWQRIAILDRL